MHRLIPLLCVLAAACTPAVPGAPGAAPSTSSSPLPAAVAADAALAPHDALERAITRTERQRTLRSEGRGSVVIRDAAGATSTRQLEIREAIELPDRRRRGITVKDAAGVVTQSSEQVDIGTRRWQRIGDRAWQAFERPSADVVFPATLRTLLQRGTVAREGAPAGPAVRYRVTLDPEQARRLLIEQDPGLAASLLVAAEIDGAVRVMVDGTSGLIVEQAVHIELILGTDRIVVDHSDRYEAFGQPHAAPITPPQ